MLTAGTGGLDIGLDATGAVRIGPTGLASTTSTAIRSGSGGITMAPTNGNAGVSIDGSGTGDVSVGGGEGTGIVSVGSGAAVAVNVGTGATEKVVTIGNATGASAVTLTSGSGAVALTSLSGAIEVGNGTGTGAINIGAGGAARAISIGGANTVSINMGLSSPAPISIGAGTASGVITIGNGNTPTINVGAGAASRSIIVGNNSGTTSVSLRAGSGGASLTASGAGPVNVGTGSSTGAVTVGNANAALGLLGNAITKNGRSLASLKLGFWRLSASNGTQDFSSGPTGSMVQVVNNTGVTFTTGNGANTGFLLQAGRSYLLLATTHVIFSASNGEAQISWRNVTANTTAPYRNLVSNTDGDGASAAAFVKAQSSTANENSAALCMAAFTPTVNTYVKLYATSVTAFTAYFTTNCIAIIEQD